MLLNVQYSTLVTDDLMILDVLAKKSKASAYRGFFAYDLPFFFNNRPCILSMQGLSS